jgi:hypothetical protein
LHPCNAYCPILHLRSDHAVSSSATRIYPTIRQNGGNLTAGRAFHAAAAPETARHSAYDCQPKAAVRPTPVFIAVPHAEPQSVTVQVSDFVLSNASRKTRYAELGITGLMPSEWLCRAGS